MYKGKWHYLAGQLKGGMRVCIKPLAACLAQLIPREGGAGKEAVKKSWG